MSESLKSCPFCGSDNLIIARGYPTSYHIQCRDCNTVPGQKEHATELDARNYWNRRALPEVSEEKLRAAWDNHLVGVSPSPASVSATFQAFKKELGL